MPATPSSPNFGFLAAHDPLLAQLGAKAELIRRLRDARVLDYELADLFHSLRMAGNDAVHESKGTARDALHQLRIAWRIAVWFQRAFKQPTFKPGPFVPPPEPEKADAALAAELEQLRSALAARDEPITHLTLTASLEAARRAAARVPRRPPDLPRRDADG